jgi:hypothetical protein
MSIEATLTLVGILVTLTLAMLGVIISFFGWWLGREIAKYDKLWEKANANEDRLDAHQWRLLHLEKVAGIKPGSDVKFKEGGKPA